MAVLRNAWDRALLRARALAARGLSGNGLKQLRIEGFPRFGTIATIVAAVIAVALMASGAIWWRLSSGPLSLDLATPWLTSALEAKFGPGHRVDVGGTVLERDEEGRTALRLRDVVVRNAHGAIIASAPKAEVGIAGASLFSGQLRAERLSFIGAELAVRVGRDGELSVFGAQSEERPLASIAAAGTMPGTGAGAVAAAGNLENGTSADSAEPNLLAAAIGWLKTLDAAGLDGRDLMEIGLKNGSLAVSDERSGKKLRFDQINLSLARLKEGGAALALSSVGPDGPWSLSATVSPRGGGGRAIEAVIRDVSPKDIMLALRQGNAGDFQCDVPLSAVIRAEIGADGIPQMLQGRILGGAGYIGDPHDRASRILVDEVQAELRWDPSSRQLHVPFELHAGPNRIAVLGRVTPPREDGGIWNFSVLHGMVALAALERPHEAPLVLNRVNIRATFDPGKRLFSLTQADLSGEAGGAALSGSFDFAGTEPRLMLGAAGTRMGAAAFKRLWPAFIAPDVRDWISRNLHGGSIERVVIAANMEVAAIHPDGPPMPEDGLSIEIV
ncbi:MAG TPA: hypothetical protein VHG27_02230, partial [Xanthobacteraceae bacterium]|nr:hypothetical protein [Xanthobacteraceae bacterium]